MSKGNATASCSPIPRDPPGLHKPTKKKRAKGRCNSGLEAGVVASMLSVRCRHGRTPLSFPICLQALRTSQAYFFTFVSPPFPSPSLYSYPIYLLPLLSRHLFLIRILFLYASIRIPHSFSHHSYLCYWPFFARWHVSPSMTRPLLFPLFFFLQHAPRYVTTVLFCHFTGLYLFYTCLPQYI